ncbi:MAG: hypothetical protein AAFZ15_23565 [Bacteroidota bacterium]
MFNQLRKYRIYFTIAFTGFYLVGSLQLPLLECLHLLTHLDDLVSGQYRSHGLGSHDESHEHVVLNVMDRMDQQVPQEQVPVKNTQEFKTKKFPQIVDTFIPFTGFLTTNQISDCFLKKDWNNLILPVPSPPPRM